MANSTGLINDIKIGDDFCFFQLADEVDGRNETFILWSSPTDISAFTRVMHSMQLSLLKDALVNNLRVTVNHGDSSSNVNTIRLLRE